jgi:hypothetical protein
MSNVRTIELNSAYRDRNAWPYPAEFEVIFSDSNSFSKLTAHDPVCDSAVLTNWVATNFDRAGGVSISLATVAVALVEQNGNQVLTLSATTGQLQQLENYYANAVLEDDSATPLRRRILEYKYLGNNGANDIGEFILETAFPDSLTSPFTLSDPSYVGIVSNVGIFVPAGRIGQNAYSGLILYNETLKNYATITSYDSYTHIVYANATGLGWTVNNAYSIRKAVPSFTGVLNFNTTSNVSFNLSASPTSDFYVSDYLRVANTSTSTTYPAPIYENKRIIKYRGLDTVFSNNPGVANTFVFSSGSLQNDYYVGSYLLTPTNPTTGYLITSYIGATRTGTISGVFGGEASGSNAYIRTAFLQSGFTSAPTVANVELLPFTRDAFNILSYSGSELSQQQEVCYDIELINLILPNRIMDTTYGSRAAYYPMFYVEFGAISSSSSGNKNIIYSNNPNATKMLFRVPIDDLQQPINSAFIKLDSDGVTQTVKFKPNSNLKFSVRLENGELFKTLMPENVSPNEPNALIQISALFSIKRVA